MSTRNSSGSGKALILFRRDLRLQDHTALIQAAHRHQQLTPCFILDPAQLEPHRWQSKPGLQFMIQSLQKLHTQLGRHGSGLLIVQESPATALRQLINEHAIDAVYINHDYTPFARKRDQALDQLCHELGVSVHWHHDALLHPPGSIMTAAGSPYRVFTPFYMAAAKLPVRQPEPLPEQSAFTPMSAARFAKTKALLDTLQSTIGSAGKVAIRPPLQDIELLKHYAEKRDIPSLDATSHLSVHLKFGTLSVREAHALIARSLGPEHPLLRQLYWRDFFTHIAWHFPHVFGHAFHPQFDQIEWNRDESRFQCWCEGTTGFPIIDAGMRELKQSGFMHNRVRMITASFLVKDLHISWRWGESWFARHLLDYDPALNNGNWQWAASTGCDAQPWFRIFNPWRQQQRFDPDCTYIRCWLPELAHLDSKTIHHWWRDGDQSLHPLPVVDHAEAASQAKAMFREVIREKER